MTLLLYASSDPVLSAARVAVLRREGFDVATAPDAVAIERAMHALSPTAVVFDLPILGLSHHDLAAFLERALVNGTQGLVCGSPELAAVIPEHCRFVARSASVQEWIGAIRLLFEPAPTVPSLGFDAATGELQYGEHKVRLTPTEGRVFETLLEAGGKVVSVQMLVERVWGYSMDAAAAELVRAHVYQLRRRLAAAGIAPLVETLPRRGYRLVRHFRV